MLVLREHNGVNKWHAVDQNELNPMTCFPNFMLEQAMSNH